MTTEELIAGLRTGGDDGLWTERAVSLVETLDGTGVSPASSTLLDDMIAARRDHLQIGVCLDNLPGLASGVRDKAEEQLRFLTMQIFAVVAAGAK